MELIVDAQKQGSLLPVTILQYPNRESISVPTLYAIKILSQELESALDTLIQNQHLQLILSERTDVKNTLHDRLQRILYLFQEFIMNDTRR